ncbi:hypothetical protein GCM10010497_22260 [Streptomyces cinereoruber]|uniref:Uncharacterized protein n=1 Tax=Streptomyces cinereoruber TaxID=67260 RepID=A0AAV4KFU5_9ACTN|nr:hypothetical protein GCM10010497_22260 [Streptomyces cinereoruber]
MNLPEGKNVLRAATTRSASAFRAVPSPASPFLASAASFTHAHTPGHPTVGNRAGTTPPGPEPHGGGSTLPARRSSETPNRGRMTGPGHAAPGAVHVHASNRSGGPSGAPIRMFRR